MIYTPRLHYQLARDIKETAKLNKPYYKCVCGQQMETQKALKLHQVIRKCSQQSLSQLYTQLIVNYDSESSDSDSLYQGAVNFTENQFRLQKRYSVIKDNRDWISQLFGPEKLKKYKSNSVNKMVPKLHCFCGKTFVSALGLHSHKLIQHGVKTKSTSMCLNRITDMLRNCHFCGKGYLGDERLQAHVARKHTFRKKDKAVKLQQIEKPNNTECDSNQPQPLRKRIGPPKPRKRRRSKAQINLCGQVQCGCGIYYSMQGPLMIHIKEKHGGIVPQGTKLRPDSKCRTPEIGTNQFVSDPRCDICGSFETQKLMKCIKCVYVIHFKCVDCEALKLPNHHNQHKYVFLQNISK